MTAFIQFLSAYSVWFYIIGVVGILYAVKMLLDARHQAHSTIFALEQEQAGEQSYRAVIVMIIFAVLIGGVSAVNAFVSPLAPTPEPAVRATAAVTKILILPTFTPIPTATVEVPTPTITLTPTRAPVPPTATPGAPASAPTPPPAAAAASPTPVPPSPTKSALLPAPTLLEPEDGRVETGVNKANNALTFRWTWCDGCFNPQTDQYLVVVSYVDQASGQLKQVQGRAGSAAVLRLADIISGLPESEQLYHKAVDNSFGWYVVVIRSGAEATPRSPSFHFIWN